jgi:hypothetical protein
MIMADSMKSTPSQPQSVPAPNDNESRNKAQDALGPQFKIVRQQGTNLGSGNANTDSGVGGN